MSDSDEEGCGSIIAKLLGMILLAGFLWFIVDTIILMLDERFNRIESQIEGIMNMECTEKSE